MASAMWSDTIKLQPRLPEGWEELSFQIVWRGEHYRISVNSGAYEVQKLNGGEAVAGTTI
ncbi:hypothetical protein D3C73_857020 [compost metagenome]